MHHGHEATVELSMKVIVGVQEQNAGVNLQRQISQGRTERNWECSAVEYLPSMKEEGPGFNPSLNNIYMNTNKKRRSKDWQGKTVG